MLRLASAAEIYGPFILLIYDLPAVTNGWDGASWLGCNHQIELMKGEELEMSDATGLHSRIRSFILKKFPAAKKQGLDDELLLLETGIVDSLGVLDLVEFLENTFHIRIDDDELTPDNFANIRCVASFVERKTRAEVPAK